VNKEYGEISPFVGSTECGIEVLSLTMTLFAEANLRPVPEHFHDLLFMYTMLTLQLLDDVVYPDETFDLQSELISLSAIPEESSSGPSA